MRGTPPKSFQKHPIRRGSASPLHDRRPVRKLKWRDEPTQIDNMKPLIRFPILIHYPLHRVLIGCMLAGVIVFSASAADEKSAIDPRADELLKRMGDYLAQARFFSVHAEIWQDLDLASGQRVQAGRTLDLNMRRPNRLHTSLHSPRRDHEMFFDGNGITLFNHVRNFYGTIKTPGSLDQAMDVASERFGIAMPLEDFLRTDPHKDLLEKVTSGSDIGPSTVLGSSCEHLAFTQNDIDWQVWIEKGTRPVPRKFVITYKDESNSPQFTAIFSNWDFVTELPDFVFKFEPPENASRIKVKEMRAQNQTHEARAPSSEEK